VQRDMDLVRDMLLRIEQDTRLDGTRFIGFKFSELGIAADQSKLAYHLAMLIEEGFLDGLGRTDIETLPVIRKLTWKGHEFLDDIRDSGIWSKTKERASGLTSVGVQFIWEIAKAEIKKKLGLP
jgi:Hypothetical protein (DUF2513)